MIKNLKALFSRSELSHKIKVIKRSKVNLYSISNETGHMLNIVESLKTIKSALSVDNNISVYIFEAKYKQKIHGPPVNKWYVTSDNKYIADDSILHEWLDSILLVEDLYHRLKKVDGYDKVSFNLSDLKLTLNKVTPIIEVIYSQRDYYEERGFR